MIIYNGIFYDSGIQAAIDPVNRGLMYGDGCFDTQRSYGGKLLKPETHYWRLSDGLKYAGMEIPFSEEDFLRFIREGLSRWSKISDDVIIRTQCWRKGNRGYKIKERSCEWIMQFSELKKDPPHPALLSDSPVRAIPEAALSRKYKLSNAMNYIQAVRNSIRPEADDVVMLTCDGYISETTIANLFWIKEDQFYTPSLCCDCYPGITREIVTEILSDYEIRLNEGKYPVDDLLNAEAAFLTNSVIGIRQVAAYEEVRFQTEHELMKKLKADFLGYLTQNLR